MSQVKAGAAYVELTTRNSKFLKGLAAAKKRLQDFGASTRMLGRQMFAVGAAATAPIAASMTVFTSFDDAMRGVQAITQASTAEFEKLRDKAKQLGATTSFSATQVASLMTELGRAGFKPDQIIDMTAAVMNLARATGTDATLASGIMAATIRQFGMEAGEAARVADGLTAAANKSFNSVESLGEALKYAGPVAADANMSLEETLAILGSLGNMGIQGSSAGSALRRLLTLSAAESEKFQKVFGVATNDAKGNARSLVDVLGEVAAATSNMGSGQKAAKYNEVFGLLGITAASAIGKSVADTRTLYKELQAAGGIAKDTATQMESGIGGSFRILKSSLEGVAIAIGESISEPLKRMTQAASGALSGLIKWIEQNQEVVRVAAKVALAVMAAGAALFGIGAALSAAGIAVGGLATLFSVVTGAITVVGSLLGALLSPLGLVLAGIVGIGAYLVYSTDIGAQALSWLGQRFAALKSTATKALGAIGQALAAGDIGAAAKILWLTLKMEWLKGTSTLKAYWIGFKDSMLSTANAMIYGTAAIISDGWASIEIAWTETIGFLADAWSLFTGTLTKTWHSTVGFIKKAWVRLKGLFSDDIDVDAEVKRINNDTDAKNKSATKQMLESIGDRDRDRKVRRTEIEQNRQGRGDALDQIQAAEEDQRKTQFNRDLSQAQADLQQARGEWQDAIAAVNQPDDQKDESESSPASDYSLPEIKAALASSGKALGDIQTNVETKGGFNAFALAGLGADSLSQRTAKATEQVVANTKVLVEQAKRGRLVFTE
ncbi:MAG: phage tail tape measure protein [Planctomycetes bacterium]|nr:phage tail tape measure protein [Planctomycetota bacterium]